MYWLGEAGTIQHNFLENLRVRWAQIEGVMLDHLYCVRICEYEGWGVVGPHANDRNDVKARLFKPFTFVL